MKGSCEVDSDLATGRVRLANALESPRKEKGRLVHERRVDMVSHGPNANSNLHVDDRHDSEAVSHRF